MKVRDLIKKLQECNLDYDVKFRNSEDNNREPEKYPDVKYLVPYNRQTSTWDESQEPKEHRFVLLT